MRSTTEPREKLSDDVKIAFEGDDLSPIFPQGTIPVSSWIYLLNILS